MKKPYIIVLIILVAAAAYFIISSEKMTKSGSFTNEESLKDLKKSGEPVNVPDSTGITVQQPASTPGNVAGIQPAPKINPEHGQPGHRCDIKTGDPLPPGSSIAPQTSISPPASASQPAPSAAAAGSSSAKLNPVHGAPGHRCDIQVGAPLPSG